MRVLVLFGFIVLFLMVGAECAHRLATRHYPITEGVTTRGQEVHRLVISFVVILLCVIAIAWGD